VQYRDANFCVATPSDTQDWTQKKSENMNAENQIMSLVCIKALGSKT